MSDFIVEDGSSSFEGLSNYAFYSVDLFLTEPLDLSSEQDVRLYLTPIFKRALNVFTDPTIRSWIISFINGGCGNFVDIFMSFYHCKGQFGTITSERQLVLYILHMHRDNNMFSEETFKLIDFMYKSSCTLLFCEGNESNSYDTHILKPLRKTKNNYYVQGTCIKVKNLLKKPEIPYQKPFFSPLTLMEKEFAIQFSEKLNEFFLSVPQKDIKEIFGNPSEGNLLLNSHCEFSVNFNLYRFIIGEWWQLQQMSVLYEDAISMLKTYILVHRSFFNHAEFDFQILLNNPLTTDVHALIFLLKEKIAANTSVVIDDAKLFIFAISVFPLCLEFIAHEPKLHWIMSICLDMNKGLYSSSLYRLCEVLNHLFAKKSPDDFLQCFENREELFIRMVRMGCSLEFVLMIINGNKCFNNEFYFDSNTYSRVFELVKTGEDGPKSVLETIELLKRKISDLTNVNNSRLIVLAISVSRSCLKFIAGNTKLHWITKDYLSINEGPDSFGIPRFCEVLDHLFTSRSRENFLRCFENRDQLFIRMICMDCSLKFILMVLDGDECFSNEFYFDSNTYLCVSALIENARDRIGIAKRILFGHERVRWRHFEKMSIKLLEIYFDIITFLFYTNSGFGESLKIQFFDFLISIPFNFGRYERLTIENAILNVGEYLLLNFIKIPGCLNEVLEYIISCTKPIEHVSDFKINRILKFENNFFKLKDRKHLKSLLRIKESDADVDSILGYRANNCDARYLLHVLNKLELSKDYKLIMLKAYIAYDGDRVNEAFVVLAKESITKDLIELYYELQKKFSFNHKVDDKILFMFVISTTPDVLLAIINSERLCVVVKGLLERRFCANTTNFVYCTFVFGVSYFVSDLILHGNSKKIIKILLYKYQYLDFLIRSSYFIGFNLLLKLILEEKNTNYERFKNFYLYNIRFLNYFIEKGHAYLEKFLLDRSVNWRDIPDFYNSMLFEYIEIVAVVFGIDPGDEVDELRVAFFKFLIALDMPIYQHITLMDIIMYAVTRMQNMLSNPTYEAILSAIFNNKKLNIRALLEERRLDPRFHYEYKRMVEDYKMLEKGYPIVPYERERSLYSTLNMKHDLFVWTGFRRPGFGTLWPTPEDFYNLVNFKPANQHNDASFSFKEENKYPLIPYEGDPFEIIKSQLGGAKVEY